LYSRIIYFTYMLVSKKGMSRNDALSVEPSPDARNRVLDAAERLFTSKGFDSVTLRDVSLPLGLTHSALYYHFPGGKEELFAEVMERNIKRHGEGLAAAMVVGELRAKLRGAASWLLSQPPMDLIRMAESDFAALPPPAARRLSDLVYELILLRIQRAIEEAHSAGEVGECKPGLLAGALFGMVENLFSVPVEIVGRERYEMACDLIDVILKGIDYREGGQRCL
jgi:TetR/AcrR family transcriptional regulator, cholesterol catabolism regulator